MTDTSTTKATGEGTWRFGAHSEAQLATVRPELQRVMRLALTLSPVDFGIEEGLRSVAREAMLYRKGASRTMNSKHLTGHAVDVVAYQGGHAKWNWPLYATVAAAVKKAARQLDVKIAWGGDWTDFKDGTHFELHG